MQNILRASTSQDLGIKSIETMILEMRNFNRPFTSEIHASLNPIPKGKNHS
jgi:hypothetical protein